MLKSLITAHDKNRVIGLDNELPWQGELPIDMRHFRNKTSGHAIIMGRHTFQAIGKPLPNRTNIVLTRKDLSVPDVLVVHSLQEAFKSVPQSETEAFVIGGGQVYAEALPYLDRLYVTEIDAEFEGDAYFPQINPEQWKENSREFHAADEDNKYDCYFVEYRRA